MAAAVPYLTVLSEYCKFIVGGRKPEIKGGKMLQRKGFTLIEILLVVAIIAFLVAILVPSIGNFGADAKDKATRADLNTLRSAVELYRINHGTYPPQATWGTALTGETNRLIDRVPDDPYATGGADYLYKLDTTGRHTYVVYSIGTASGAVTATPGDDTCTITSGAIWVTNAKAGCTAP